MCLNSARLATNFLRVAASRQSAAARRNKCGFPLKAATVKTGVGLFGESRSSILKEDFLPLIELRGIDLVLLADRRDGAALQQMLAQDFDLVLRGVMPPAVHGFVVHALFLLAEK
jgi:hypothetical protein